MKMLQKTLKLAAAFIGVAFFSGCETIVEVPIPEHTPKLALRYMLSNQEPDSVMFSLFPQYQPYVNHSQSVFVSEELKGVNNATLTVTDQNSQVVETFRRGTLSMGAIDDGYYEPVTKFKAQPGHTYTFSVSATDFPTATSKITMPSAVSGVQATFQKTYEDLSGSYGIVNGKVSVTLPDNGAEKNFYQIYGVLLDNRYVANARDAFREETDDEAVGVTTEFQNIHFSPIHYGDANPFDDVTFNGKTITFTRDVSLFIGNTDTPPRYLRIYVHSITEGAYRFLKSLKMYNENGNNPFAEQTRVLGNVDNGYGYFGGFTSTYYDIVLPQ